MSFPHGAPQEPAAPESGKTEGPQETPVRGGVEASGEWARVLALAAVAFGLSVVQPSVLVGVPLIGLLLVYPTQRLAGLVAGALAALLVFGGAQREGLWFAERGWGLLLGGWFAALSLRFPAASLFSRAVGAVAGAMAIGATVLATSAGSWEVLDWLVGERMAAGVAAGLEVLRLLSGERGALSPAVVATVQRASEFQVEVFPALVALASLASLGLAWWLHSRLAQGERGVLSPVRDFRFSDHFVWVLVGGLGVVLAGWGEAWGRAGVNAVVFMGALYALRGMAVALFLAGSVSLFGVVLLLAALLFVAPLVLAAALLIGLLDTWLDLRGRVGTRTS